MAGSIVRTSRIHRSTVSGGASPSVPSSLVVVTHESYASLPMVCPGRHRHHAAHGRSAYFLLVAPGEPTEFGARAIANIHRLTLGETSSIVGAIFLAAGIRPAEQGETRPKLSPIATLSSHRKTQSAS